MKKVPAKKAGKVAAKKKASRKLAPRVSSNGDSTQNVLSQAAMAQEVLLRIDNSDINRALQAAHLELSYIRHWGGPSPKFDEVFQMLARHQPGAPAAN